MLYHSHSLYARCPGANETKSANCGNVRPIWTSTDGPKQYIFPLKA